MTNEKLKEIKERLLTENDKPMLVRIIMSAV